MATFTEDDIISAVTFAIGSPSLSEYPDAPKRDALRRALTHYSQYKPLKKIGSFDTIVDVQNYDIASSYAYLVGVKEVFYGATSSDLSSSLYGFYDVPVNVNSFYYPSSFVNQEAMRVIDERNVGVVQKLSRYETHMLDDVTVSLIPTPVDVRTIFFEYNLIKTVADLRENEYQDIIDFTFIIAAMDLANKRHKILQLSDAGSFLMFQGGKFLEMQVEKTRERLQKSLGVNSLVIHG